jgi:hypothetical protein
MTHLPQSLARGQHLDAESRRAITIVTAIEGHDHLCPPIDRSLENHLIARVPELRPPAEECLYRLRQQNKAVREIVDLLARQTRSTPMLQQVALSLVLQHQSRAK